MEDWKEKFINYTDSLRTAEAISIRQQNMPEKIYRYRPGTDDRDLENLKNDTVWLCSPEKYNDPYDSALSLNYENLLSIILTSGMFMNSETGKKISMDEIEKIKASVDPVKELLKCIFQKRRFEKISEDTYEKIIEKSATIIAKSFRQNMEKLLGHKILSLGRNLTKICSFSETKSSIIMWSHYAKNHEGFCIEYDLASLDEKEDPRDSLFPVIYSDQPHDITHFFGFAMDLAKNPDALEAIKEVAKSKDLKKAQKIVAEKIKVSDFLHFMFKSQEWAYEKEWRLYFSDESPQPDHGYPMPTPSAIYLGARMTEKNKKRICDIAEQKKIDVYQMTLSGFEFKLFEEKVGADIPESFTETEEWNLFKDKLIAEFPELESDSEINQ